MLIRLRYKGNNVDVRLKDESTLEDLFSTVESHLHIPPAHQLIKCGFPPLPLKFNDSKESLNSLGVLDNDLLIIENDVSAHSKMYYNSTNNQQPADTRTKVVGNNGFFSSPVSCSNAKSSVPHSSSSSTSCSKVAASSSASSFPISSANNTVDVSSASETYPLTSDSCNTTEVEAIPISPPSVKFVLVDPNCIGEVRRHTVPSDNSCLFSCIKYLVDDNKSTQEIREIACCAIRNDEEKYSDVMLEKPRAEYMEWIRAPTSWGGFIELSAFADYYKMQFAVQDIQTVRLQLYGSEYNNYRVYLLYDGIHYDALHAVRLDSGGAPANERYVKVFSPDDCMTEIKVKSIAEELNRRRMFTNVVGMSLRCIECQMPLKGQKEAQMHAKSSTHVSFAQIS